MSNDTDTLRKALEKIADMDPQLKRADDLGRAARIAHEALADIEAAQAEQPALPLTDDDIERLSLQAGFPPNRKDLPEPDFHTWCNRMRNFLAEAAAPTAGRSKPVGTIAHARIPGMSDWIKP